MSRQPEPEFQCVEDAILGLTGAVFTLGCAVVTIFVNLVFAIWSAVAGSDDVNQ